jgi:hypothetical protein
MAYLKRKNFPEIELWNVSLLPTVRPVPSDAPPRGPAPLGGSSLQTPALLSVLESTATPFADAA